jgi:hypothetical protein
MKEFLLEIYCLFVGVFKSIMPVALVAEDWTIRMKKHEE